MLKIALIVLAVFIILFALTLCRVASIADAQMEKDFQVWMAQRKDKQENTAFADL